MILNHIFELYLIFLVSIFLHEFFHLLCAKVIGVPVHSLHIGEECFAVRIGNFCVSPIVFSGGYIEFYEDKMRVKRKIEMIVFFLSGSIANGILIVISQAFQWGNPLYGDMMLWSNVYILISNLNPIFPRDNDMIKMLKYVKKI